jgi:hypothetical protein
VLVHVVGNKVPGIEIFGGLDLKSCTMSDYANAIRAVGAMSCILASDLGRTANPLHPDGLAAFFAGFRRKKFRRRRSG